MDSHSAPRPYYFLGLFYQKAWHIIGGDVILSVKYFFAAHFIQLDLNSNFLILIPKSEKANSMDKFRLIVLGNFMFKVITKIITDRLAFIASWIISPNENLASPVAVRFSLYHCNFRGC